MSKHEITLIYEDADIIVVNKPSGVSVTADRSGAEDLRQLLTKTFKNSEDLRLVHRLDKDTSGVLLMAKTPEAQSAYSRCFASRTSKKVYLALVEGIPYRVQGYITSPIYKDDRVQKVRINTWRGKKAKSFYKTLMPLGPLTLLAAMPITGRTHQLRIHLQHKGMPLAIDPLYASDKPLFLSSFKSNYRQTLDHDEKPLIDRLTLHAYQLTVPVGPEQTPKTFVAPLDKKFSSTIKLLAKHTSGKALYFKAPQLIQDVLAGLPIPIEAEGLFEEDDTE